MSHDGRAIGIDLGTSNSVVAVIDADGAPRIVTTAEGDTKLPSLVWFSPDGPVVGEGARAGLDHSPDLTIFGAKRLLGRRFDHPEVRRLARVLPYALVEAPNGDTRIALPGGRLVSPEEVSALILRELRRNAERHFRAPVTGAVITVPAWFDVSQRQAVKDAAEIAGLQVLRLLSEPTAAALGHGAHRGDDRRFVVCDLGGGTFDVAIVDVAGGIFEVLAVAGDPFLGGDDVDRAIVEHLVRDVRATAGLDVATDAVAIERLRVAAQAAKHALSQRPDVELAVAELAALPSGRSVPYRREVRRDELEAWAEALLRRLGPPCREALLRASRRVEEVDEVLLVGGMTRMPAVRTQLARVFGAEPRVLPNPEEVVAVGAALEVARLEGAIDGVLLVDACAHGLAMSVGGGPRELVIDESAVVPTREVRVVPTRADGQRSLDFDLWEGDASSPSADRHLGRYVVGDLPEAPAGEVLVVVELTLDADGTVRVAARELVSGQALVAEEAFHAGLPRAEVARLVAQLAAEPAAP